MTSYWVCPAMVFVKRKMETIRSRKKPNRISFPRRKVAESIRLERYEPIARALSRLQTRKCLLRTRKSLMTGGPRSDPFSREPHKPPRPDQSRHMDADPDPYHLHGDPPRRLPPGISTQVYPDREKEQVKERKGCECCEQPRAEDVHREIRPGGKFQKPVEQELRTHRLPGPEGDQVDRIAQERVQHEREAGRHDEEDQPPPIDLEEDPDIDQDGKQGHFDHGRNRADATLVEFPEEYEQEVVDGLDEV